MSLKNRKILLGITGGIAAYKMAYVASALHKMGAEVQVIMTKNATEFITPLTFETLINNKVYIDTFDRVFSWDVKHISLTTNADLFVVAPATANFIAKAAVGMADDMLTSTFLAATCPKVIYPAMNTHMYENVATQRNMRQLEEDGMIVVSPASGRLACGDVGKGRLPEPDDIVRMIHYLCAEEKDLAGKNIVVTAGPTREFLDPVRYLSNLSSGKMGYAIATCAAARGANVTLISGPTNLQPPIGVHMLPVVSAAQMYEAVMNEMKNCDVLIKAAAVADYTPASYSDEKIKKKEGDNALVLNRTADILKQAGSIKRPGQFICGFSMETKDLIDNSKKKLESKNADMIVANNLKVEGAGFGVDTNVATIITADGCEELPLMSKEELANNILDRIKAAMA